MGIKALYLRSKFWIKDWLKGASIYNPYKEIKGFYSLPYHEATETQKQKLNKLLEHANKNSDFYKSCNPNRLDNFPIVDKHILLSNYNRIAVPIDAIPGQIGELHIQSTSGSTGTPFKIPQDTRKRYRRIAELKYFGKIVGFKSHEALVHLRTWNRWQNKTPKQIKQENIYPFDISVMGDSELATLCHIINSREAICLRGYSSSFNILATYVSQKEIKLPTVKIIIAGSEALHDDVRLKVKQAIGCEIISQYANEECGILAQESIPTKPSNNTMYLNHAGYVFECLKFDKDEPATYGELGRLVVTDLHNYAFPIIRYDTGDAAIFQQPDESSNGFPVLHKLYGRRLDICYATNGSPISPMVLGRILKHYDKIAQWQFIQKKDKEYCLKIIFKERTSNEYLDPIIDILKQQIGEDANIIIEIVDGIPTLASGKRKAVVNEWKNK